MSAVITQITNGEHSESDQCSCDSLTVRVGNLETGQERIEVSLNDVLTKLEAQPTLVDHDVIIAKLEFSQKVTLAVISAAMALIPTLNIIMNHYFK